MYVNEFRAYAAKQFAENPAFILLEEDSLRAFLICENKFIAYDANRKPDDRFVFTCTFNADGITHTHVDKWNGNKSGITSPHELEDALGMKFEFGRGAAFFSETKPEEKHPPTAVEISAAFNDMYQIGQSYFAVNTKDIKHAQGLALAQACDYLAELLRSAE